MKKTALILFFILTISIPVNAEKTQPVRSELSVCFQENFQKYGNMKKYPFFRLINGHCNQEVLSEDTNKFLRIYGLSKTDNRLRLNLDRYVSGEIAIEFDLRVSNISQMQIPSVIGVAGNQKANTYVSRLFMNDAGNITLNDQNFYSWVNEKKVWRHIALYMNTESGQCKALIDDKESANISVLESVKYITGIDFMLRGKGTYIDIDNISISPCVFDNLSAGTGGIIYNADNLDMPLRRARKERPRYELKKLSSNPALDGTLENVLSVVETNRLIEGTDTGTKLSFGAGYTDKGIYVLLKAYDKNIIGGNPDINTWLMDSFELFIDAGNEHSTGYDANDMQLTFTYNINSVGSTPGELPFKELVEFNQFDMSEGWYAEVFVPAILFGEKWMPDEFGFDVGYNDCFEKAGTRTAHYMWAGDAFNARNTSTFGMGKFVK